MDNNKQKYEIVNEDVWPNGFRPDSGWPIYKPSDYQSVSGFGPTSFYFAQILIIFLQTSY
ncbi:hypothetical protein HanPSC8_Chr12g0513271 [Helianthus annuus]|nr:hypothetical protein HanPSC8_Chr12g0513271 [Helianthus annuus]